MLAKRGFGLRRELVLQVPLVEDNHMVETLTSNGAAHELPTCPSCAKTRPI